MKVQVAQFIRKQYLLLIWFASVHYIDTVKSLNNDVMDALHPQFEIYHYNSACYRPQMNGDIEAAKKILQNMTDMYKIGMK